MTPRLGLAAVALLLAAGSARAEMLSKSGDFAKTTVEYKVLLPPGYDASKPHPVVLVFTGGAQGIQAAQGTIEADWQAEAEKRGYVVISPGAPDGELFFQEGDRVFPAFLDMIRKDYKVAGKIHIAGHSNGGLSAFHIAAKYPQYFSTVTGYPGLYQDNPEDDYPAALKGMCLYMHAGDMDPDWRNAMAQEAKAMSAEGFRIKMTVEPNSTHRLKSAELGLSKRLFDEIESCR
ncbi:MAG TPA: alpha/beta hydrolase-fold protein [Caulobacteraceae bacterium]